MADILRSRPRSAPPRTPIRRLTSDRDKAYRAKSMAISGGATGYSARRLARENRNKISSAQGGYSTSNSHSLGVRRGNRRLPVILNGSCCIYWRFLTSEAYAAVALAGRAIGVYPHVNVCSLGISLFDSFPMHNDNVHIDRFCGGRLVLEVFV